MADYHSMSRQELIQAAKEHDPPIKQYYTMKRIKLIQLLTMKELPQEFIIEKMKLPELRKKAKEKGIPNIYKLRRQELLDLLFPSLQKNNENNDSGKKHDDPKQSKGE